MSTQRSGQLDNETQYPGWRDVGGAPTGVQHRIGDLIVLGRAGPEPIKDGRHTVCLGGYSPGRRSFVRIYPTRIGMRQLRRWNVVSVPVDPEAEGDARKESWKIEGSREEWDALAERVGKTGRLTKPQRIDLIDTLPKACPKNLNDERLSLGLVKPGRIHNVSLEPVTDTTAQHTLSGQTHRSKRDYPYKLYITYSCDGCEIAGKHHQHCIEWGIYRYWDKNPESPEKAIDSLKLNDPEYQCYFFVGNLRHHLSAYIVISVLRFKRSELVENGVRPSDQAPLGKFKTREEKE